MTIRIGDLSGRGPMGLKQDRPTARKRKPVGECKAIRDSARGEPCTLRLIGTCNSDWTTTVFCHLRMFGATRMGQKPADYAGVYGCSACHDALDGRDTSGLWGHEDVSRALMETHRRLAAKGLLHMGRME